MMEKKKLKQVLQIRKEEGERKFPLLEKKYDGSKSR